LKTDLPVFLGGSKDDKIPSDEKEMIIFVGSPGSGKSTFYHTHLKKYERIN